MTAIAPPPTATWREINLEQRLEELKQEKAHPILAATIGGDTAAVEAYLKADDKLYLKADKCTRTVFYLAAEFGHVPILKLFERVVGKLAKVLNAPKNMQRTPLHEACMTGSFGAAKWLLDKKATRNTRANDGHLPVSSAQERSHLEIEHFFSGIEREAGGVFLRCKLVVNFLGLEHNSYRTEHSYGMNGGDPGFFYGYMARYFKEYFYRPTSFTLSSSHIDTMYACLNQASLRAATPDELVKRIKTSPMTLLSLGWNEHAFSLVFFAPKQGAFAGSAWMLICNRGDGRDAAGHSLFVYPIDFDKLTPELVKKMYLQDDICKKKAVTFFYQDLRDALRPGKVDLKQLGTFRGLLQSGDPKAQGHQNCVTANAKAACLGMALCLTTETAQKPENLIEPFKIVRAEQKGFFTFTRLEPLDEYMCYYEASGNAPSQSLLKGAQGQLEKHLKKAPMQGWVLLTGSVLKRLTALIK